MLMPDEHKALVGTLLVLSQHADRHMLHLGQQLLKANRAQSQNDFCWGGGAEHNEASFLGVGQEPLRGTPEPATCQLMLDLLCEQPKGALQVKASSSCYRCLIRNLGMVSMFVAMVL